MTEATQQDVQRDPILDKEVTLKFTVEQVNQILSLLGSEISYIRVAPLIHEIQAQCAPQVAPNEQ